jgi:type II secretory pathway component GspD/PulD (secretin)
MRTVKNSKLLIRVLFIFAVLFSLNSSGYIVRPGWAVESEKDKIVFSLEVKEKSLGNVLKTISKQTGYDFLVNDSFKSVPITIKVSNTPLEKGLNRVLKAAGVTNHALVFDPRKRITIIVIEANIGESSQDQSFRAGRTQDEKLDQHPAALYDRDKIPIPSEEVFARNHERGNDSDAPPPPPSNWRQIYQREDVTFYDEKVVPQPPEDMLMFQQNMETSP